MRLNLIAPCANALGRLSDSGLFWSLTGIASLALWVAATFAVLPR